MCWLYSCSCTKRKKSTWALVNRLISAGLSVGVNLLLSGTLHCSFVLPVHLAMHYLLSRVLPVTHRSKSDLRPKRWKWNENPEKCFHGCDRPPPLPEQGWSKDDKAKITAIIALGLLGLILWGDMRSQGIDVFTQTCPFLHFSSKSEVPYGLGKQCSIFPRHTFPLHHYTSPKN